MELSEIREMICQNGTCAITYHDSDYNLIVEMFDNGDLEASYLAASARQDELIAQREEELG